MFSSISTDKSEGVTIGFPLILWPYAIIPLMPPHTIILHTFIQKFHYIQHGLDMELGDLSSHSHAWE